MSDFDPQDVITVEPPQATKAATTDVSSDFDPKDVISATPAGGGDFHPDDVVAGSLQHPGEDFHPDDVLRVEKPEDHPAIDGSHDLTDEDFQRLGQKYKVDPKELRELAPYYGAISRPHDLGDAAAQGGRAMVGGIGRMLGGIPQFAYKKLQDPQMRGALDELSSAGREQRGTISELAEGIATPLPTGEKLKLAGRLATAGGVGGALGLTGSKEGQELKSTAFGVGFGLGTGALAEGLGHFLQGRATKAEQEALLNATPHNQQLDIKAATESELLKTKEADDLIGDLLLGRKESITPDEAELLVKQHAGGEENIQKHIDPSEPQGAIVSERTGVERPQREAVVEQMANDIVDTKAREFAHDLTGETIHTPEQAVEAIEKFKRQGEGYLEGRYEDFKGSQAFNRGVEESGLRASAPMGTMASIGMKASDSQFPLRLIDEKYGTRAEEALADLNQARNKLSFPRSRFRHDLEGINQVAVKVPDVDKAVRSGELADAIEGGAEHLQTLDPTQQDVAQRFKDYFSKVKSFANGGVRIEDKAVPQLAIPELENYIPHIALPVPELIATVENRLQAAVKEASFITGREVSSLKDLSSKEWDQVQKLPAVKDLVEFRNWRTPHENVPPSGGKLQAEVLDTIRSRSGKIELDKIARASQERTGEIPEFIREKNLYQLADRYTHDVLSNLYQRKALDTLRNTADKLSRVGADKEAAFVQNIATDTLGVRKGTVAEAYKNILIETARMLDGRIAAAEGQPIKQMALQTLKAIPVLPQFMSRALYPNVLGWNIRAITQNLVSGISRTAPELGTRYGYQTYVRGMVYGIANKAEMLQRVTEMGHVPDEFIRAGERATSDGIRNTALVNWTTEKIDAVGKASMALFETSEKLNRISILSTARLMSRDIQAESPAALGALQKMPYTIRRAVLQARENPEAVEHILGRYLIDATAFQYSRPAMFEFGRTMGPLFSTFAKWPTAMLGESLYELQSKGLLKGGGRVAERLLPPVLVFMGIDHLLNAHGESDRRTKALGKGGLAEAAPVNSLIGLSKGNLFTPPIISAVAKGLVAPAGKADAPGILKGLDQMAFSFIPLAGTVKFLTDDMATYITGQKPEGSTEIQRVVEGARALSRKAK